MTNGNAGRVSLKNIPGFLYKKDLELEIEGIGRFLVDIGFGENFFVLVDIDSIHDTIKKDRIGDLRKLSRIILKAANEKIHVVHPEKPSIDYLEELSRLYLWKKPQLEGFWRLFRLCHARMCTLPVLISL